MKITKKELREVIQEVADELGLFEGLTKAQEKLPEPLKKAILKKQEQDGVSDDSDDENITEGIVFYQGTKKNPDDKGSTSKFQRNPMGKTTLGETGMEIARFLNLPNAKKYTGHCFRYNIF